jgi:hypothetical protein
MANPYFDELMQRRQVLLWAVTARRQLDRWEPLVVEHLQAGQARVAMPPDRMWQGEAEHHFAIVAFDHMLEALKLWPVPVQIPKIVEQEIAEVRELATHWKENMPVFNQRPRSLQPKYPTGRPFAARNPARGPYCWWAWSSRRGAMLTPNVAASDARDAIHTAEQAVLAADPDLAPYVPPKAPSPWIRDEAGNWWAPHVAELP